MARRFQLPEKYVVFKQEEFDQWPVKNVQENRPKEFEDSSFFVIRDSDIFGPAVMWAYAHTVATQLEMVRIGRANFSDAEYQKLEELHSYVVGLAEEWSRKGTAKKVPD